MWSVRMNAITSIPGGLQAALALTVTALTIVAALALRARRKHRAAVNGRMLVEAALLRRGILRDEFQSDEVAHAIAEARVRCSDCRMQRACLSQVAAGSGTTPSACPNRSPFDRLADRVRRPAMRRFRLRPRTPGKH